MEKTIVTLSGKDTVGIIAKVCTFFARNGMNILDISQTTMRDVISMTMIVDSGGMPAETAREGIASLASESRPRSRLVSSGSSRAVKYTKRFATDR